MRERLDKVEDSQGKTEFRSTNNESRIEVLESQVKDHKDKLLNLSKDFKNQKNNFEELENKIRELKQQVNQKVDNDVFEQEINCK
jgi:molecular chaperone GrpE (heat shock protein)